MSFVVAATRIRSLDVVRGVMLVASVVSDTLLVQKEWFGHTVWEGVHPLDLVFPVFVTLTGCGLAFAMHRRVPAWPMTRRVLVLVLAGLLYNAIAMNSWSLGDWWLTGVLQLYAGVVAVLALLHLVTRRWWGWAIVTVVLGAADATLQGVWATGCAGGVLSPECNPSGAIDPFVFGVAHVYHQGAFGHDPVGLVALLGALVSASAGATAGHLMLWLRERRDARGGRVAGPVADLPSLLGAACAMALLGWVLVTAPEAVWSVHPLVMKRLWTPPFALWVAAGTVVALGVAHVIVDRPRLSAPLRALVWPLEALGRNSLLVYFGSHALMSVLTRPLEGGGTAAVRLAEIVAVTGDPQLGLSILMLGFWLAVACVFRWRGWYLRP
ncbi:heparan-alpha-glucosaminide N-acetyltransferase domain-containing protein [Herbiconiux moechotypicola]|uniref:Heparan-alpha-glucosaminide N-acetyltransferase catalytic domain-containing protein n=1 Tax=Herbiconiux moechotypicola TaxID=637393 RepID=A0ABN3E6U5_9MICO|nr:heparan-alpha-glucosaminide N-acetyltransferase domain-containing protein [Herbiconiux moechotypicola]MCS5731982.1 heparan-alpha-glucosaminide N-acetyltransferase domain-containing protein [Herbiconiux moechotypicola]